MIGTRWRRASNANLAANINNLTVDASSPVPSLLVPSPRTPTASSPRTPTSASSAMPRTPTSYQSSQPRPSMTRTESSRSSNSGEGSVYRGAAYAASTPRLSTSTSRSTWEMVDAASLPSACDRSDRNMQSIRTTRNFIFPLSEEHGPVSSVSEVEGRSGKLGFTGFVGAYEDEPVVVVELRIDSRKTVPIARSMGSKTPKEMVSTLDMVRSFGLMSEDTTVRQTTRKLEPERPERRSMIRHKNSIPQLQTERIPIPPPVALEAEETSPALSSAPTLGSSIASPITPSVVFVPSPPSPAMSQFPADDIAFPLPPTSMPTPQQQSQPKFRRTMSSCSNTLSTCSTTSSADMPTYDDQVPMYPRPPPRRERRTPASTSGSSFGYGSSIGGHSSNMSMGSSIAGSSLYHSDELESVGSKRLSQSSTEPTTPTTPTTPTSNNWTQTRVHRSPSHSHQRAPIFKRSMSFRPASGTSNGSASPGVSFTVLPASEATPLDTLGESPAMSPKFDDRRGSTLLGTNHGLYEANPSLTDIIAADHETHAL
ncbi:hypothetical protein A1Q2_02417 [Trichosporon asahii var. asahii CBS 8904]|uniref:Uncharacterized protein n=1 Tax=Trichosporon asahii var. asahii (strain CBS 8904) TaxID=1220162 RepID=K1VUX0_TRIAC|nr:hypothetical protein A1Q2_02417 [Trichosporon asahii var. asahii CBS 8904]